ncbi:galactose ABC transporter substrate-binding protein [Pelosinus sp. sgz500959]|uniref:galactose ABC transporter substrate-binding protein n=1 Tax=Pelosinus sp. sgz500959 TaxID=3242472 RepID=UPI003671E3FA
MKKYMKLFITVMFFLGILALTYYSSGFSSTELQKKAVIGVIVGTFDDTWRTCVRNEIYKIAEGKIKVDIWNGNNSQTVENEKIDLMIQNKISSLAINLVDSTAAGEIIEKVKKNNLPVIFFNREPLLEELKKWDKAYYVGAKAEQSGTLQGQILVNYFKTHPTANGVIRYAMLKGEPGHQDAELRTKYVIKAMEDAGFHVQKVAEDTGMWDRIKGQEKMELFLSSHGDGIDCVIANNDDMALGAIDALKNKGYFQNGKYIPVVGVDATTPALKALSEGTLLGTVLNDAVHQGRAIFNLANVFAEGKVPSNENIGYKITDGKYVWIDYKIITKENINDAK